jgi:hypothetical protein
LIKASIFTGRCIFWKKGQDPASKRRNKNPEFEKEKNPVRNGKTENNLIRSL